MKQNAAVVALVLVLAVLAVLFFLSGNTTENAVDVIQIEDSSCSLCGSSDTFVEILEEAGIPVRNRTVEYDSAEGAAIIANHSIERVPTILISSNILDYPQHTDVIPQSIISTNREYLIFQITLPPYRDVTTDEIAGLVEIVYINDSTCRNCYDVLEHKSLLELGLGVTLAGETFVDVNSTLGRELVDKYNITRVPTYVMSPDARFYSLADTWSSVGTVEQDGWYVFRNITAINRIHRNLDTGVVVVPAG